MSELIKPKKENQFWDTSCIMHNKTKLSEVLGNGLVKIYTGDLNNILETGIVYADTGATNKPPKGNGYCITLVLRAGYKKQIYYVQTTSNISFERVCHSDVWTEWIEK